ncbi:MAG: nucleoside-diphosphate sugar epimerase/dehydratase, partial [Candidatus Hodarchaeota archaeon]
MRARLDKLFDAAWPYKKYFSIFSDAILITLSLFLCYVIRLGSVHEVAQQYVAQIFVISLIIVPFKILVFWFFQLYHISFRYVSLREVISITKAAALSSPMIALIALVFRDLRIFLDFPRSVIFIDFFLTFFFVTGIRAFFRLYYSHSERKGGLETLIVGAGAAGEQLVRDMIRSPQHSYLPIGFIDDNPKKKNTLIHGIRVLGGKKDIPRLVRDLNVKEIVIAIPSATSKEIRAVMDEIRKTDLQDVKVLPSISDLMNGKVT